MGTQDPLRAILHFAVHVDRSFLCCRAISLSDRPGVVHLSETNRGSDYRRWNLFPVFPTAVCVSTTARRWLARRDLRLVSRNGCAVQSASIASRGAHANSARYLFSSYARFHSRGDYDLVRSHRVVASSDVSTSRHRHRRWFCPGRILLLPFSRAYARVAGYCESPHRLVLRSGSGSCLDYWRDLLAMGSPASLASDRSRHRGDRVLPSGSDRFSQDRRKVAVEHAVCVGALFARSISVVAVLPEAMSIVGQGHTTNLDWRQTGVPFCEQSFVLRGCLRA